MSSTLYADEISSIGDSRVVILNGIQILADDLDTDYILRAVSSNQASWTLFDAGNVAPVDAEYITVTLDATLTNERTFASGTGIATTDNGAGSTFVVDTTAPTTTTGRFYNPTLTVDAQGRVTNISQGRSMVLPVRAATSNSGTFNSSFADGSSIDGVTLSTGDRILIKDQTNAVENGIYLVNSSGAPTRDRDFENLFGVSSPVQGFIISVNEGQINQGAMFICNNTPSVVIDTDPIEFRSLGGINNRTKLVCALDIDQMINNRINALPSNIGQHYDIHTSDTIPSPILISPISRVSGISIDGKFSALTQNVAANFVEFQMVDNLVLKNLNLNKTVAGNQALSINNCDIVLISGCRFSTVDQAIQLILNNRVIISNCIFEGNGTLTSSVITITGGVTSIINCQFLNCPFSDNSIFACIDANLATNIIVSGNTFVNCGKAIQGGSSVGQIFNYNTISNPSANPTGTVVRNLGSNIRFGYIELDSDNTVCNNNNIDLETSTSANNFFTAILRRNSGGGSVMNGNTVQNITTLENDSLKNFACIGWESGSINNVVMDNNSYVDPVAQFTGSFIIVGDNCVSGYIGHNETYATTDAASTTLNRNQGNCYNLSTTGNDLIKLVRGNVAFDNTTSTLPAATILSLMGDHYEFDSAVVGTIGVSFDLNLPRNSGGYRIVFRRNNLAGGGAIQISFIGSSLVGGTGIEFPGGAISFAVVSWNGTQYDAVALVGGAFIF